MTQKDGIPKKGLFPRFFLSNFPSFFFPLFYFFPLHSNSNFFPQGPPPPPMHAFADNDSSPIFREIADYIDKIGKKTGMARVLGSSGGILGTKTTIKYEYQMSKDYFFNARF